MLKDLMAEESFEAIDIKIDPDNRILRNYYKGVTKEIETEHVKEIMDFVKPSGKILNIGCGYGMIGMFMMGMSDEIEEVTGLDITPQKIDGMEKIIDTYHIDHIECIQGDASELPYPDQTFDYTFLIESVSHIDRPAKIDKALEEAVRVLKDNGTVSVIDLNNGMNPRMIYRAWSLKRKKRYENPVNPYFTRTKLRSLGVTNIDVRPYNFPGELKGFGKDFRGAIKGHDRLGMFFSTGFMLKGRKVA
jgi:ubiquinone/menaquinone biosynthesis C-methylase UbiE